MENNQHHRNMYNNSMTGSHIIKGNFQSKTHLIATRVLIENPEPDIQQLMIKALSNSINITEPFVHLILAQELLHIKEREYKNHTKYLILDALEQTKKQSIIITQVLTATLINTYITGHDNDGRQRFLNDTMNLLKVIIQKGLRDDLWTTYSLHWVSDQINELIKIETHPVIRHKAEQIVQIINPNQCVKPFQ